ncbi:LacI family DNA-binding transcriptional regulator [Pseudorhodobacter sp. W20_MBD10_FR17]|uniref:LacI family DNA-binding transcriptional regulator n=1 Tax=Pseudorhodobacter sp. W20_MBD10_FR17 TaxID=3240266 RepID=UPI003F976D5D
MSTKPKLQTVAQHAGVSLATVSQVMRGAGRISEETRKKVLQAAKDLNYVPDGRAASMRSGENREIGLVIHGIANPFNAEVISGVSDLLESEGYLVSVLDSRDDPAKEARNLEAFIRSARGGLLWVPTADIEPRTIDLLATHRIPTVTFLRRLHGLNFDHVGIENTAATKSATNYLADLGHTQITFFGGTDTGQVRTERIAGYRAVLAERNLGEPIIWPSADNKLSGLDAVLALRKQHPQVTALVCNGDMVALGACLALQRLGQTPGKEMSVIGFDDISGAAVATPPLTTLAVSPTLLGRKLARVLLDRIQEPNMPTVTVTVPAQLVVRGTTGQPA